MFEYSLVDVAGMLYEQPNALKYWIRWLGLANMICLFFVWKHKQARWVAVAMLVVAVANIPMAMALGLVKALSIPHLVAWIPLTIYLAVEVRERKIIPSSAFGIWVLILMVTNTISVVFDIRDSIEYVAGDRAILAMSGISIPYYTLAAILLSIVAMAVYCRINPFAKKAAD